MALIERGIRHMNELDIGEVVFKGMANAHMEVHICRFIEYKLQYSS